MPRGELGARPLFRGDFLGDTWGCESGKGSEDPDCNNDKISGYYAVCSHKKGELLFVWEKRKKSWGLERADVPSALP